MRRPRKLRVGVFDIINNSPTRRLWSRFTDASQASVMAQVIALWCEQEGHEVHYVCYTGAGPLLEEIPTQVDLAFVGAPSRCGQLAYALSHYLRTLGVVTALGGPHARSYPQDAGKYFDYVLGFTDREIVRDVLLDCSPHRSVGVHLSARRQPRDLPGVRERWKFIELAHRQAPLIKLVPMLGSLGCPYTCSFCIDAEVPYQPLRFDVIRDDLRFLLQQFETPRVVWHDPNFGVRFNDYLDAIEEAVPPGRIHFLAESSLSLLSEPNLKRLKRNGFKVILPGVESWYDMGNKTGTGSKNGMDKVRQVAEHFTLVSSYIPYVQANFILGLDADEGPEPFELTKRFFDLVPGAFPYLSLLTAFGQAAPLNLRYQEEGRILPFPFHFLNNNRVCNVKLKNYSWPQYLDQLIGLKRTLFSWRALARRVEAAKGSGHPWLRWVMLWRSASCEKFGRIRNLIDLRQRLEADRHLRRFWEGETAEIPSFYLEWMKRELGPLWEWLPAGALHHDPNAYLKSSVKSGSLRKLG